MQKIMLALVLSILTFSGCATDNFSRYPSVAIMQCEQTDYLDLLTNRDPEVVYNAIVNLGEQAKDIGEVLNNTLMGRKSAAYLEAERVYRAILQQLHSTDARIVSAALRYLQLLGLKDKTAADLLPAVLKVHSNNPQVLYEQVMTLTAITSPGSAVPENTVRMLLANRSWIVSRSAYTLVDSLENEPLRQELAGKYAGLKDEKEKLLLLSAFRTDFSDETAGFLFRELLSTDSRRIRHAIYDMLPGARNPQTVLAWLKANFEKVMDAEGDYLFQQNASQMKDNFPSQILCTFLENGYPADERFLQELAGSLAVWDFQKELSDPERQAQENLLAMERAVESNPKLTGKWKDIWGQVEAIKAGAIELRNEFDLQALDYAVKMDDFIKRNKLDASPDASKECHDYKEQITNFREHLLLILLMNKSTSASNKENTQ